MLGTVQREGLGVGRGGAGVLAPSMLGNVVDKVFLPRQPLIFFISVHTHSR